MCENKINFHQKKEHNKHYTIASRTDLTAGCEASKYLSFMEPSPAKPDVLRRLSLHRADTFYSFSSHRFSLQLCASRDILNVQHMTTSYSLVGMAMKRRPVLLRWNVTESASGELTFFHRVSLISENIQHWRLGNKNFFVFLFFLCSFLAILRNNDQSHPAQ